MSPEQTWPWKYITVCDDNDRTLLDRTSSLTRVEVHILFHRKDVMVIQANLCWGMEDHKEQWGPLSCFPLINFEFKDEDEERSTGSFMSFRIPLFDTQEKSRDTWLSVIYHFHPLQDVSDTLLLFVYASIADFSMGWWYFHVSLSFMHVCESRRKTCCLTFSGEIFLRKLSWESIETECLREGRSPDTLTKRYFLFSCRTQIRKHSLIVSAVEVFLCTIDICNSCRYFMHEM